MDLSKSEINLLQEALYELRGFYISAIALATDPSYSEEEEEKIYAATCKETVEAIGDLYGRLWREKNKTPLKTLSKED